jgi:hypothetical protein
MGTEVDMTPENKSPERKATRTSPEPGLTPPLDAWKVYRGRLQNHMELGPTKGKKTLDRLVAAVRPGDQEHPVLARIEIQGGKEESTILKLDSRHPQSKSNSGITATEWLERVAEQSAKLQLIEEADGVPYPIREAAKQRNRPLINAADETLRLV